MYEQLAFQKILIEKYSEAKVKNSAFSMRAYAKRLGVSSSAVSEIFNGKRRVTKKMAKRVLDRLYLPSNEVEKVLSLFPDKEKVKSTGISCDEMKVSKQTLRLTMAQFEVVSNWYHFAILSLLETHDCSHDLNWMSTRLGISNKEVLQALNRLEDLGAITIEGEQIILHELNLHTTDGVPSSAICNSHIGHLELARESLETDSVDERDFTSLTIAVNSQKIDEARKLVRDFRKQMEKLLSRDEKDEVYVFATQLFPATRRSKK